MGLFDKFNLNPEDLITKKQLQEQLADLKKDISKLDATQKADLVAIEAEVADLADGAIDQAKGKDILTRINTVEQSLTLLKDDINGGAKGTNTPVDGSDAKLDETKGKLSDYSMKIKENPQKVAAMQKEIEKLDKDIEARKARIDVQMKLLEKWREKEALTNKELDIVFEMTQLKLATIESEFERDALKQVSNGKYTKWEDLWLDKRKARIDEAKKEFFEITKRDYDQECLRKGVADPKSLKVAPVVSAEFKEGKIVVTKDPAQYVENLFRSPTLLNAPEYKEKGEVQKSILNVIDNHQAGDVLIKINSTIGQSLTDDKALKEYMKSKGLTDVTMAKTWYAMTTVMGSTFGVAPSQVEQVLQSVNPNVATWTGGVKNLTDTMNKEFGSAEQEIKKIQTLGLDGWVAEKAGKFTNAGQYAGLLGMGAQAFVIFRAFKWFISASLEEKAMGVGGFIAAFGIMPWDVFTPEGRARAKNPLAKWGGLKSIDKELKTEELASYGAAPILTALYNLNETNKLDTYKFIGIKDGAFTLDLKGITEYLNAQPFKDTDIAAMESREMFRTLNKLTDGQTMVNSAVTYAMSMMGVDAASFTKAKADGTIETLFDTEIGLYDKTDKSMKAIITTQGKSDYEIKDQAKYDKIIGGSSIKVKDSSGTEKEINFIEINDPNNTNDQQKKEVFDYLVAEGIIGQKGVVDADGKLNQAYLNQMTARIEKDIFDYNVSGIDAFEPSVRTPEQMKKFKDSLILSLSNLIKENPNDQITYVKRTIDGKNYLCLQNKDVAWPLPLSSYGSNHNGHKIYSMGSKSPIYDDGAESIKEYVDLNYQLLSTISRFRGQSTYAGTDHFKPGAGGIQFRGNDQDIWDYVKSGGPLNATNNLFDSVTIPPKLKENSVYLTGVIDMLNSLKSEDNRTSIWYTGASLPSWMIPDVYRGVELVAGIKKDAIGERILNAVDSFKNRLSYSPQSLSIQPDNATVAGSYLLKINVSGNEHMIRIVKKSEGGYVLRGPLAVGANEQDRYNLPPRGETLSLESAAKFASKVLDFEIKNQGLGHPDFKDVFYANDTKGFGVMGYKFGDVEGDRSIRFIKKLNNNAHEKQDAKRFYKNSIPFAEEEDLKAIMPGSDKDGGNYFIDHKEMVADWLSSLSYDDGHKWQGGSMWYRKDRGEMATQRPSSNPNVTDDSIAKLPGHAMSYVYHSFMDPLMTLVTKEIPDFMRGGPADLNEYIATKIGTNGNKKSYEWIINNFPGDTPESRYLRQTFVVSQLCNYSRFKPFFAMVNHMTGQTLTKQVLNKDTDDKEIMEAEVPLDRTSVIQLLTGHAKQLADNHRATHPNLAAILDNYNDNGGGNIIGDFFLPNKGGQSGLDRIMDMNMSAEMQSKLKTDPKLDWGTIVMNTFASYPVSMGFDMNTSWEGIKKLAGDAGGGLLDFMSDKVAPAGGKILESLVGGFVGGLSGILDRVDRHLMNDDDGSEQTTEEKQKEIEEIRNRNNKTK